MSFILTGCNGNISSLEDLLNKLNNKQEEFTSIINENNKILKEIQSKNIVENNDTPNVGQTGFLEFLEMSVKQRNELIDHYVHSGRGGRQISGYDLYMMVFLLHIFEFNDMNERFIPREQEDLDTRLASLDPNLYDDLPNYVTFKFNKLIDILGNKGNIVSFYDYKDSLYLTIFQDNKFVQRYYINSPNSYLREMFIKVSDLTFEFLNLQCGQSQDC
jgi:hypothetical protein